MVPFQVLHLTLAIQGSRSSNLTTPKRPIVYHNHRRLGCIKAAEPHFVPSSLCIPQDMLSSAHMQHERLRDICVFAHAIIKGLEPTLLKMGCRGTPLFLPGNRKGVPLHPRELSNTTRVFTSTFHV